jgi:methyltransferase family protein
MTLVRRLTSAVLPRRWDFTLAYLRGRTPWDSGISPPELVEAVEGPSALPPGHALDIGCGTGTNGLYLARHGWHVTGLDFAAPAITAACAKAAHAGPLAGSVRFLRADVTRSAELDLGPRCSLLLDLGCLHGIPLAGRAGYVAGITRHAAPRALFLLYAFQTRPRGSRALGLSADEVRALFAPAFEIERLVEGSDRRGVGSAWYWLRRVT